nr:copper resistance CopC family protein [Paenibacillus phyllosphaerae]
MLVWPQSVSAHTGLKSSSPAKDETITSELKEIELNFNTVIEPMTVLTVTDAQGAEIPVKVEAGDNSIRGAFSASLANGAYKVEWRIIGEDGHNITGEFAFDVAKPETQESPAVTNTSPDESVDSGETTSDSAETPADDGSVEATSDSLTEFNQAAQSGTSQTNTIVITIAGLLLLAILIFAVFKIVKK